MRLSRSALRLGALGTAIALLIGVLVASVNPAIHSNRGAVQRARELKELDTRLSLLLMRVRHSLLASYDPVVTATRAMEGASRRMLNDALGLHREAAAIEAARRAAAQVIQDKLAATEDFKTSFAVLRNSISLLGVVAVDLGELRPQTAADAETYRRATVLLLAVSRLLMGDGPDQLRSVERARAALAADAPTPGPLVTTVETILSQTALVQRVRAEADQRLAEVMNLPVGPRLDELITAYGRDNDRVESRRRALEVGLGIAALVSVALAVRGLRAQRRTRLSLENRVEERTRDLAEANATLTRASRAKTDFLANMSHEIRTPLAAILGFADLLEDQHLPHTERRDIAHVIRRNGEHLLSILNDILEIAKIEAGKLTVEAIPCSPRQIVEEVCALMRKRAAAKRIELRMQIEADGLPRWIESDPTRLRQILVNLVGNAIKFTEEGSISILLAAAPGSAQWLRFEVRDTGIGMTPEEMTRIFAEFEQADTSTTRRFGGTGLGLAICRRLTAVLGGEITVQSAPGQGSTFTLMLPVTELRHEALDLDATAIIAPRGVPPRSGLRVLVADDSADIQLLVTRFLADVEAEVAVVSNGRQAVETALTAAREGRGFDVILMDLHMPELDGAEAVQILRTSGMTTPILALTASAYLDDRERCARAGYTDFLTKPIDRGQLIQKIATLSGVGDGRPEHQPAPAPGAALAESQGRAQSAPSLFFNANRLLEMVGGDHSMRDAILEIFQKDAPALLQTLHNAVSTADVGQVRAAAHKLKGMLLTVGASHAAAAATALETSARAAESHRFEPLVRSLETDVHKVCESMAQGSAAAS